MEHLSVVKPLERQITELEDEIRTKKRELAHLRRKVRPKEIPDYTLLDLNGKETKLSELFRGGDELLLIFNMGKNCRWCTLWADGFNGIAAHLESRAPFALISPDTPAEAKAFSSSRDWRFDIFSDNASPFRKELGLRTDNGIIPAAAAFLMDEKGKVFLTSVSEFGPGDNYCVMYDLMDLLPKGYHNWNPQYSY